MKCRLVLMILASLGGALSGGGGSQTPHDGVWWRSVDHYRHLGFLEGYMDCDAYVHPESARFVGVSPYDYEDMIDRFYKSRQGDATRPVAGVMLTVAPAKMDISGKSTFGVFDGESWRQGGPSYRLGFIEGYFECLRSSPKPVGRFSKPESYYVHQISRWYGVKDDDPGAIDMKRDREMIAHVLFMFKDQSSGKATH